MSLFSLKLNGVPAVLPEPSEEKTPDGKREIYRICDTLTAVRTVRRFDDFGAEASVLTFENPGDSDSPVISCLCDFDGVLPFGADGRHVPGYTPEEPRLRVQSSKGSMCSADDFRLSEDFLPAGGKLTFASSGGRSCQPVMPFFDMRLGDIVEMLAVGWTGGWFCDMERTDEGVRVRCGVAGVETYLKPGEKVRTSQVLRMRCAEGQTAAHNRFRRLIKAHYTPGTVREREEGRLCMMVWGGAESGELVRRINKAAEEKLPFDFLWMDAGWYGHSVQDCPSEFTGDWYMHTGSWNVNPTYHPDGLLDVSAAAEKLGAGFMLWIEPERAKKGTDWPKEHPEYFLSGPNQDYTDLLLNLGDEEARKFCVEEISGIIERLNLKCYRQDFNMDPLVYWQTADEPGRRGMTELKYVEGLYAFWDALLTRFPGLLIDNCASGGRRIDIEMMSRSLSMWRTDYTCVWDCDPEMVQGQHGSVSWWIPYCGANAGRTTLTDYAVRSGCGSSYNFARWGYSDDVMDDSEKCREQYEWLRRAGEEYHRLSAYFSCDYYPLLRPDFENDTWTAWQYDRPEKGDGVILVFRKSKSAMRSADLRMGGVRPGSVYTFTESGGDTFRLTAEELAENGFRAEIGSPCESRVWFYKAEKAD